MNTPRNFLLITAIGFLSLLWGCGDDDINSNVSFSSTSLSVTTDDLAPINVSLDISPSAPSNSTIDIIVTGATYGEAFTTNPALSTGEINVPVDQGSSSAGFIIIPNVDEIGFDDINLEFEIIAVGSGLSTAEFEGRFFDLTIQNNNEPGTGLPYIESFANCGADGNGEFPPVGWTEVILAQNSFESSFWRCYTGQGTVGIQINAFSTEATETADDYSEAWFISPMINLTNEDNPVLSFDVDRRFDAPINATTLPYGIQIATDYDGSNFESANWQVYTSGVSAMTANDPDSDNIESTGDLDLSTYSGEVISIAFIYRATDAYFGANVLRIANVVVQ